MIGPSLVPRPLPPEPGDKARLGHADYALCCYVRYSDLEPVWPYHRKWHKGGGVYSAALN